MHITERDLGWVAGFLEGEGSFSFSSSPRVLAAQVQREPLERLVRHFGGSLRLYKFNGRNSQPIHHWKVSGRTAAALMMTLYALMSPRRREQIAATLTTWRNGPGSGCHQRARTHCPRGHAYDEINTRYYINARGYRARECWTCRREVFAVRDYEKNGQRRRDAANHRYLVKRTARALLSA